MKFSRAAICLYSITSCISAAAIPDSNSLSLRDTFTELISLPLPNPLEKRKGGGGGKGGSSSSGSSSSGSSSSGSSGSSSGSSSSGSGAKGSGSGVTPSYGGGRFYGGGATTPYRSGSRSPLGVAPLLFLAPALAFGGLWAYGAYAYPYSHPYSFRNQSSNNTTNTTLPVQCLCAQYSDCGCDDNNDTSYLSSLVGNGSASDMNSTLARVANVNGTQTLLINGTLPNGTTADGTTTTTSGAQAYAELSGWWMMVGIVTYTVWFI